MKIRPHISFFIINSENYDKSQEGSNENKVIDSLRKTGLSDVKTLQKAYIVDNNYYEFSADEGGRKLKVVGIGNEMQEYPIDSVLPYFE